MQDSSDPHARLQTPQTTETEEKQNIFVAKKSKEGIRMKSQPRAR